MTDRRAFYEQRAPFRPREQNRHYHRLLQNYYAFLVPPGLRVLEVGCGLGDLLAAVKPARGLGLDFSPPMIDLARRRHPNLEFQVAEAGQFSSEETFDYIILSDLVNDLPDVQWLLERLRAFSQPRTRLVLNFFNNSGGPFWPSRKRSGQSPVLPQNWLSPATCGISCIWLDGK